MRAARRLDRLAHQRFVRIARFYSPLAAFAFLFLFLLVRLSFLYSVRSARLIRLHKQYAVGSRVSQRVLQ